MNISRSLIKRGGAMLMKPLKHNSRMPETSVCNSTNSNNSNSQGSVSQTDQSRCKAMEEEEKDGEGGEDRMEASLEGCNNSNFDCNICLESSQEPVVTMCGHLFCWACLYKWLNSSPHHDDGIQQCPVCKAQVKDKIIPLYGRGKAGYASSNTTTATATTDGCKEGKDGTASNDGVIDIPSRPSAPRIRVSSAAAHHHHHHHHHHHRAAQHSSRFPIHRQGSRNHGMSFHDAYPTSLGGGNLSFSASFGLFPALFGFQLGGFPEYNHSFSYDGSSSSSSIRALDARANANANAMVFHQRVRWNNSPQELLLHWSFILLVFFVVGCFLFF